MAVRKASDAFHCTVCTKQLLLCTAHRRMRKFRLKQVSWTGEEDEGNFADHAQKNGQKTCQVFV